jgi:hypothetical protein
VDRRLETNGTINLLSPTLRVAVFNIESRRGAIIIGSRGAIIIGERGEFFVGVSGSEYSFRKV